MTTDELDLQCEIASQELDSTLDKLTNMKVELQEKQTLVMEYTTMPNGQLSLDTQDLSRLIISLKSEIDKLTDTAIEQELMLLKLEKISPIKQSTKAFFYTSI